MTDKTIILESRIEQLQSEKSELLELLSELYESAEYWSEYDVPIGIVERIKNQLDKHNIKTGE